MNYLPLRAIYINIFYRQEQKLAAAPESTNLEHLCNLNIHEEPLLIRKTGIICTIGKRGPLFLDSEIIVYVEIFKIR